MPDVTHPDSSNIDLYLASASPRRRDLLNQIGIRFELISGLNVDESLKTGESPEHYVRRLAEEKARAGFKHKPDKGIGLPPVLGADTCIAFNGKILGKPVDKADAVRMLSVLSGHTHQVLTAICLFDGENASSTLSASQVSFKILLQEEIEAYWETGEPEDKAGSYAIQGKAAKFITELSGSYSGVVGLPLYELSELLVQISSYD